MKTLPPEYTLALFNLLLVVVMGVVAWLIRRAVQLTDEKVKDASDKLNEIAKTIGEIRVQIAGDQYTRKEQSEYARHVDEQLNMLRKSIHDARDSVQPLVNRVTILEALKGKEKQ